MCPMKFIAVPKHNNFDRNDVTTSLWDLKPMKYLAETSGLLWGLQS